MKKYLFIFVFVSLFGVIYLMLTQPNSKGFVKLEGEGFTLNNQPFYPIAVNYLVRLRYENDSLWACSPTEYTGDTIQFKTKKECLIQLKSQMELIKEMGFNTIRVVSIGELNIDEKNNGNLSFQVQNNKQETTSLSLSDRKVYSQYLSALKDVLNIAAKTGLKVILLNRMSPDFSSTKDHLMRVCHFLKNDTALMAYDLYNEPLYFDKIQRSKTEVYKLVKSWNQIIKTNTPFHLSTIGLEGVREVFEWDPNIVKVDFISYHPYEYEEEQVRNEIYWFGKYTKKPWIIGETAIPADNDSIPYSIQQKFAEKTLKQTQNCGGIGYSWWQYKDVNWPEFHSSYMGVVSKNGETKTSNQNVSGTPKPIVKEFLNFNYKPNTDNCLCLDNYYNYSKGDKFRISGVLLNDDGNPVEGGVILGWNQWWSHSYHTITKKDGSFELLGTYPFYHWMASATEHTMIRGEINPDTANVINGMPEINLGELKVKELYFIHWWKI